jgi:hypothetical protein
LEVKIIGLVIVPIAYNLDPRVTNNEPCVGLSPRIIVPGRMVNVAEFLTYILFCNKITPLQVVLVVISVETVVVVAGSSVFSASKFDHPEVQSYAAV